MTTLRLFVVRHGECEPPGIFYGQHDVGLSARGCAQVDAQVRYFETIDLHGIYASDLRRARAGAEAIARGRGVEVVPDPALREMHLGCLEMLPHAEARVRFPELAGRRYLDMLEFRMPEGGESVLDVAARVLPCVEGIVQSHARAGERGSVIVYAHNTVCRILLAQAVGLGAAGYGRFVQHLGAISRIDFDLDRCAERSPWTGASVAFSNFLPGQPR